MKADAIVLGAGIVGVSIAAHLAKRGRSVVLVDRRGAGEETSYGNAGLIQREGVYPYGFPHDFGALLRYATNRTIDAHYHVSALPKLAPFLFRYWLNSRASHHEGIARQYARLIEQCVVEHRALAQDAGVEHLLRPIGWLKLFRTEKERDARLAEAAEWKLHFGVESQALDQTALRAAEPHIDQSLIGALHFTQPDSCSDPGALTDGYRKYVETLGGKFMMGDAGTLEADGDGWRVQTRDGAVAASQAVLALGPWADLATIKLGYRLPLAVKRGYHMHYKPQGNAVMKHPMLDIERGYFLAPMAKGIRLTTGAEFALRDAAKTPVQLGRAEPIARALFPLGEQVDPEPWMGCRPCTPDMMPVIGPAPKHKNLWFAFGHAHHGMTLGAVTGRMIAEMMVGEKVFVDPYPFRADRPGLR